MDVWIGGKYWVHRQGVSRGWTHLRSNPRKAAAFWVTLASHLLSWSLSCDLCNGELSTRNALACCGRKWLEGHWGDEFLTVKSHCRVGKDNLESYKTTCLQPHHSLSASHHPDFTVLRRTYNMTLTHVKNSATLIFFFLKIIVYSSLTTCGEVVSPAINRK